MSIPYILLGNGRVAARFLEVMAERATLPRRIILNAPAKQRDADTIRHVGITSGVEVLAWSEDTRRLLLRELTEQPAPWILSVYFGHLLDQELLDAAAGRAVNLHASLLPWGRGAHTNVWPIVEHSPAGVTLHIMDARVDRGAILVQKELVVAPSDTGASLYRKLESTALALLLDAWPDQVLERWPGIPQPDGGSEHRVRDLAVLDDIDVDRHPEVRRFYDILRARSFPPYPGVRLKVGGRTVEATILLRDIEDE